MAITDEAVWNAEYTSAALKAFGDRVGTRLKCTVYYKGDTNHRKGRHRSRNWALKSAYCTNRGYGTTDARDKRGPGDAIRAGDVMIAGETIRDVCRGVDEAVRAGRLPELAEWFGTLDGETVAGWVQGKPGTSDTSHLTHFHFGVWTQFVELAEFYDRLFDAMMTYIDGGDMTPEESRMLRQVYSFIFLGGDKLSCGDPVPTEYAMPGKVGGVQRSAGNSAVEQLRFLRGQSGADVDEAALAAALAPLLDAGATPEEVAAAVRAELDKTRLTGG